MRHDELTLERRCRELARRAGWITWKNENNGLKGIPDDSFLSPDGSRFLLIEFKRDEKQKPRPEQQHWMERYPNVVYLAGSEEQFKSILQL